MKRIQALVISLLFLITNNIQASFLEGPNPYSFGPQGRSVSDLRDFAKPKGMVRILPNRPVAATDSSGNRVYYTPDGKMTLSIAKDGSMSFSLSGVTKGYNSDGELKNISKTLKGKGLLQEVRNEKDEVVGYKTLNGKGKVAKTYDKDMNLTATYVYKGQGAKIDYIQNEMTKGRTYYDDYGREMCTRDFDGYIMKTFLYTDVEYTADEKDNTRMTLKATKKDSNPTNTGLLVSVREFVAKPTADTKYDAETDTRSGTVETEKFAYAETFFDLEGKTLYTKDADGFTTKEHHYKQDDKGNKIMDYLLDVMTGNRTYYDEHGTASYTVNDKGSVIARYFDGYTVSLRDGFVTEVTKYDIDGKELYTTLKNIEYDTDGTIKKVIDTEEEGDDKVWHEYVYTTDRDGKKVIDYVINHSDFDFDGKDTYTWYEDGKPIYTTDSSARPVDDKAGNILRDYNWNGDTLVFTFDRKTENTHWYNVNKELVYITFNERVISKNIYNKGQLIGKWNAQKGETTIYINERAWITVTADVEPTPAMITGLISHASEINADVAKQDKADVANKLMDTFGWNMGASLKLLTEGKN